MSGHKRTTVTISQEEYRRLYEAEMLLRGMDTKPFETNHQPSPETLAFLSQQVNSTIQRQENFLRLGQELQTEFSHLETQTAFYLREIQGQILEMLNQDRENFINLVDQIQNNLNYIEEKTIREHEVTQQRLAELDFQSQQTFQREKYTSELAHEWLNDCVQIYNFILENYPESIPHLEELRDISSQLGIALQNFESGLYEAALTTGQNLYISLSSLRVQLEKEGLEKRKILAEILEELRAIKKEIVENREIKPIDLQGNFLDTLISVDEWTDNSLSNLEETISSIIIQFEEQGLEHPIEYLRDFKANQIPLIQNEFLEAIHQARLSALNAHLNYLIAHDVLLALIEQGYKPVEGHYKPGEKDIYIAKAEDPLGNVVEIQVQTSSPEKIEHHLHIISTYNQTQSLHELRQRAREIQRSLKRIGWVAHDSIEIPSSAQRITQQPQKVSLNSNGNAR